MDVRVYIHLFFNSALVRSEWLAPLPARLTAGDNNSKYPRGRPRTGLDDGEKKTILSLPDSNSDPTVIQPVSSRYYRLSYLSSDVIYNSQYNGFFL